MLRSPPTCDWSRFDRLFYFIFAMSLQNQVKQNKNLFRDLPYFGQNITLCRGQFNDLIQLNDLPNKKYLERLPSLQDIDLFTLNLDEKSNSDSELSPFHPIRCKYYSPLSFYQFKDKFSRQSNSKQFSLIHSNIRSLKHNLENFQTHLLTERNYRFSVIGITETRTRNDNFTFNPSIPGYNFEFVATLLSAGGVGMYIDSDVMYTVIPKKKLKEAFQALWIQVLFPNKANIICGVIYRQHNSPERFQNYFEETIGNLSASRKSFFSIGDANINLLHCSSCNYSQNFLFSLQNFNLIPTIDKPPRVGNNSFSLIDNIFTKKLGGDIISVNVISDITDHCTQFCIVRSLTVIGKNVKCSIRDYSHFSEENFSHDLSQIDWQTLISEREP